MKLIEGQKFKNFKALCVYMGWIEKDKILSTGSKRKLEKDLSQICCWEKLDGSNCIVIKEIYESKKKRLDGRNLRNKYVKNVEMILLHWLRKKDKEIFISNSKIGFMIDLYNNKFFEERDFYSELAENMCIDRFLIDMFLLNSKSEVSKIISRAMDSMLKSNVLIGEKGIIIRCKDEGDRMATEVEEEKIKNIENEVLELLSCKTKAIVWIKNKNKEFKRKVKSKLIAQGMGYIDDYYQGCYIESFDKSEAIAIDENEVVFAKESLKIDVIQRLICIGNRINEKSIKKEYDETFFGEPLLMDISCSNNFVKYWGQIIDYFMLHEEEID